MWVIISAPPRPQGRDPARAGPRAVPPLLVRRLCPSTSGKLPQGRLVAVQREHRLCLLAPTEPEPQGLSQGPPTPPSPVGSWPIACLPGNSVLPPLANRCFRSFPPGTSIALSPPRLSPNSSKWPVCCVLWSCLSSGSHGCCVHQTHYCTSQLLSTRLYSATGPLHRLLTLPAPFLHHSICCSGGSQPGVMLPPRGHLAISLDFRGCHKWRRRFYWDAVGGSQTAAKHPPMHRTIAHSKESSGSKCPQRCG